MTPAIIAILFALTTCTPDETAYYESQGWDAYECDGDKAERVTDSIAQHVENIDTEAR